MFKPILSENTLFDKVQNILDVDGDVRLYDHFFSISESDILFKQLIKEVQWRQESVKLYGKTFQIPRLTAWYGDEGKSYTYSGIKMEPVIWLPVLLKIKHKIELFTKTNFNSVLINLYRNGNDSVAWHSDDEVELGINPVIGSVSLGATRQFVLKHKFRNDLANVKIHLGHGSYLVMSNETQHYWLHQIPKTRREVGTRINLTFRKIN